MYPLLFSIAATLFESSRQGPVTFSVAGSQGSGKTTMSGLLVSLLADCFGARACMLSLDDFYLGKQDRQRLAREVHPMLATRGVPGTHDAAGMEAVLGQLVAGQQVEIPVFDKAADDRSDEIRLAGPVDVVICEGWCWGCLPEPAARLNRPVNALEAEHDPAGAWRTWVNDRLGAYQSLFRTDGSLYYLAPSMDAVFRWRLQQEEALRATGVTGRGVMDSEAVQRFIGFYERLTRWMMETLPARVDVCVALAEDHRIASVTRADRVQL